MNKIIFGLIFIMGCGRGVAVINAGCSVVTQSGGALISCPDGSSSYVPNGVDGQDAVNSAYEIVEIMNPCGDAPGVYDEILLKLSNGTVLASFSSNASGQNTRLGVLSAGTYVTTDGDNCTFTLNSSGNIFSQSHNY